MNLERDEPQFEVVGTYDEETGRIIEVDEDDNPPEDEDGDVRTK